MLGGALEPPQADTSSNSSNSTYTGMTFFPLIHILGEPKTGTTSLHELFNSGSGCETARGVKELPMWYPQGEWTAGAPYDSSADAYVESWRRSESAAANCSVYLDSTPTRLESLAAPAGKGKRDALTRVPHGRGRRELHQLIHELRLPGVIRNLAQFGERRHLAARRACRRRTR